MSLAVQTGKILARLHSHLTPFFPHTRKLWPLSTLPWGSHLPNYRLLRFSSSHTRTHGSHLSFWLAGGDGSPTASHRYSICICTCVCCAIQQPDVLYHGTYFGLVDVCIAEIVCADSLERWSCFLSRIDDIFRHFNYDFGELYSTNISSPSSFPLLLHRLFFLPAA